MKFLLFQIYAPLVSWGEIAVGGERQSSRNASKSAIIGLVAAALGIKREDESRLNTLAESIGVAIKLYSGGSVLKDFHTVQVPRSESKVRYHTRQAELSASSDKLGTILSKREYRCDSLTVAAIYLKEGKKEFTLEQIEQALRTPFYQLYFGRKSCVPALPLSPKIVQKENLKAAFDESKINFPLPVNELVPEWLLKSHLKYPEDTIFHSDVYYFWEEDIDSGITPLQIIDRYDQPLSRKRWQFGTRKELMAVESRKEA